MAAGCLGRQCVASPLLGSLATTIGNALASTFLDATLTRDVAGVASDPADPPAPTQVSYSCKAIEQEYGAGLRGQGLVGATDIEVLILANSFKDSSGVAATVEPAPLDRITIRSNTVSIVGDNAQGMKPVRTDPARATWMCRCKS